MRFSNSFYAIDSHTGGQPTRIIQGLAPLVSGETMNEKRAFFREHRDNIRHSLCREPRGHRGMYCAVLTEPVNPEAEVGVVFMSSVGYDNMCGHGTIGVVTALIETGMVENRGENGKVVIDTPSGPVETYPRVKNGHVESVSFQGLPSFVYKEDVEIELENLGLLRGSIGFGGNWYYYLKAGDLGIELKMENINPLLEQGSQIKKALEKKLSLDHPTNNSIDNNLTGISIYQESPEGDTDQVNVVVESNSFYDRSPCGTGTCGRMAILHSEGRLTKGASFVNKSITGSVFRGEVLLETKEGDKPTIVPKITGSAYLTGFNQLVIDPDDPLKNGF
ncbi:proline racemase family protein [Candidatus Bipolaricaulota bacterium]|nr:proline racemase family protein [Candidatus Bipolaricaulota bacterium]